jgi:hypothetical protein
MSDGVYCKRKVFGDKFIFYKDDEVPDTIKAKEDLAPIKDIKIPAYLLYKTMGFFKYVLEHYKTGMEAYVLYALKPDGKYFMYVPEQQVGAASVHYDISEFHKKFPGCYIVADAHSHSTFGAFWSGTDTTDDCRGRYSVVIGKNAQIFPEIKCRFNYGKKYIDLTVEDIYEDNVNYDDTVYDLAEMIKNLTEVHEVATYASGYSGFRSGVGVNVSPSLLAEADEYYAQYYENLRKQYYNTTDTPATHDNFNKTGGVGRCSGCGKFLRLDQLDKFEDEILCKKCAKRVGAFHVCP